MNKTVRVVMGVNFVDEISIPILRISFFHMFIQRIMAVHLIVLLISNNLLVKLNILCFLGIINKCFTSSACFSDSCRIVGATLNFKSGDSPTKRYVGPLPSSHK